MQANPTSILVDMVSTSTKEFSMSDVFMLANTKNQGCIMFRTTISLYHAQFENHLFCLPFPPFSQFSFDSFLKDLDPLPLIGEEYGTSYIPAKNKNFSVVNKLFCVLEEKSTLARMVLLPECGTKLTPGQSIGHAVLVNKQNFGEALVAAFLMDIEVNVILAHNREERRKEAREQDNVLARAREVHDRRGERNTDNRGANLAIIYPTYRLFCF